MPYNWVQQNKFELEGASTLVVNGVTIDGVYELQSGGDYRATVSAHRQDAFPSTINWTKAGFATEGEARTQADLWIDAIVALANVFPPPTP